MEIGKNKWFFLSFAAVLVLLYLMSSTDLIIHEKKVEVYPVSVIVSESTDEDYEKLRKGMDRAAEEFHVDLSFITLYEANDQEQQTSLVAREIADGARAVILMPANPREAGIQLDDMILNSPMVVLGEVFPNEQVTAGIAIDYAEAGKLLGQAVMENPPDIPVYLISEGLEYGYAQEIYDGIRSVLEETDYQMNLRVLESADDCRRLIESTVYPESGCAAMIALDEKSLETAAGIIRDSSVYGEHIAGLYGIGGTTRVLNDMDQGIIRGMVVHNWFDEGYLSIEKAVEAIQGVGGIKEQITMDAYYITKENLRDEAYEKMLYPID
ncbi:MAG: substrate-binding domain-containing protein [Lachnospiraceae bacterium]|nr:substrate-binding domain-containing protein [Lachnospiraceae bacterium]